MEAPEREFRASIGQRLLVVAGAVLLGILLQQALGERLAAIGARAEHDRIGARAELALWIRIVVVSACGLTAALGFVIARACRNPRAAERFPPPGLLSIGARRAITGPRAQALTRIGFGLGLALLVVSLAGAGLAWYVGAVLLACRA